MDQNENQQVMEVVAEIRDILRDMNETLKTRIKQVEEEEINLPSVSNTNLKTIERFIDHALEISGGIIIDTESENKSDYVTLIDLYDRYLAYCKLNDEDPVGKRIFSSEVVNMYSPDPENISTFHSGYIRFAFIQPKPIERRKFSDEAGEHFFNRLIDDGSLTYEESEYSPSVSDLYREFAQYIRAEGLKTKIPSETVFKMLIVDQYAPDGYGYTDLRQRVLFFHDKRVEKAKTQPTKKKNIRRKLPSSPSKENTN